MVATGSGINGGPRTGTGGAGTNVIPVGADSGSGTATSGGAGPGNADGRGTAAGTARTSAPGTAASGRADPSGGADRPGTNRGIGTRNGADPRNGTNAGTGSSTGAGLRSGPTGSAPTAGPTGTAALADRATQTQRPAAPRPPAPPSRTRADQITGPGDPTSRRRLLVTIVVVVLAVAAAVLIPFAIDRAADQGRADAGPVTPLTPVSSAPPTDRGADASTSSPEAAAPPPPGFRLHRDPTGFSIAVPDGWREVRDGTLVDFRDPTSSRLIRIDQRPNPRYDPYADWLSQEPAVKARLPGYDLDRIAVVQYRGWPTADWEFTWGAPGRERIHVLNRSVVPHSGRGYALYWSTPDSQWTDDLDLFATFVSTFSPIEAGR